jgi:HTH-type transcriptional regulator, competence development regulator
LEKTFGETIKKLREKKALKLREVANELAIDTSMLGKIEKNQRKPNKDLILKMSKFFDVSYKDLMVAFKSDTVVYRILENDEYANEVLKVAEKKLKYVNVKSSGK